MTEGHLAVITTPQSSVGFALAGVSVFPEVDGERAAHRIDLLISEAKATVVMIEEALYRELPEEVKRMMRRRATPVVIPIPGPSWGAESTAHDYIVEILRRAIGYRVRLQ
ncbi:MAG: V-type ATP synthase subunit F [Myxococcales bacterium]|jgi:vacuolar-type H+-ATPase subunit F/Vma7|nr:V-type ATP synthase subunit F [Myxococcales bacterium]MDH3843366.1 V-type ATP synthase subunit F [Myxococcales bacterium]